MAMRSEVKLDSEHGDTVELLLPFPLEWAAYFVKLADDDDITILGELVIDGLRKALESYDEDLVKRNFVEVVDENGITNSEGKPITFKLRRYLACDFEGWKQNSLTRRGLIGATGPGE